MGVVFSNELLDSFPVHRLIVRGGRLCEFYVAVGTDGNFEWLVNERERGCVEYLERDW